jgi:hypothetical protein
VEPAFKKILLDAADHLEDRISFSEDEVAGAKLILDIMERKNEMIRQVAFEDSIKDMIRRHRR